MINLENPVTPHPNDPDLGALMSNLQGNILKGHGRDHTVNLFLRFNDSASQAERRRGLGRFAERLVTSAAVQHSQATELRQLGVPGDLFCNLMLSASGYAALGVDPK